MNTDPHQRNEFRNYMLVVVVLLLAVYSPFLLSAKVFYFQDTSLYFEPLCQFIGKSMAQGKLPSWNPFLHCGMPEIALASPGIFYPPNFIFAFGFSFSEALAITMVFHQAVAAAGGYLLVASLGWSNWAAMFSGIVLGFCGYNFSLAHNYTLVAAASWVPLILLALKNICQRFSYRWFVACAVFTFLEITAGRPEILVPSFALFLAAMGAFVLPINKANLPAKARSLAAMFGAITLGTLMAAPVLIPAAEWLPLSKRLGGLVMDEVLIYSASWYDIVSLLLFQPLGNMSYVWAPFRPVLSAQLIPYVSAPHIGAVAFTFALFGAFDKTFRWRFLIVAGTFVALLFSLGGYTPVMPLALQLIPGLSALRFPIKFIWFVTLGVAILAGRGVHATLSGPEKTNVHPIAIVWAVLLIPSLWLLSAPALLPNGLAGSGLPKDRALMLLKNAEIALGTYGLLSCFTAFVVIGLIILHRKFAVEDSAWSAKLVPAGICLFTVLNLTLFGFLDQIAGAPDFYQAGSILKNELTKQDGTAPAISSPTPNGRVFVMFSEIISCPPWLLGNDAAKATEHAYQYNRQLLYPNANVDFLIASPFGFEGALTTDLFSLLASSVAPSKLGANMQQLPMIRKYMAQPDSTEQTDAILARFCKITATRYAITQFYQLSQAEKRELPILDNKYFESVIEQPNLNLRAYKLRDGRPRVYLSNSWRWVSHEQALKEILAPQSVFDQGTVLLEGSESTQTPASSRPGAVVPLNVKYDEGNLVEVQFDCAQPSVLVLSDQFYPGWTASLDDRPVQIWRANALMKAILVQRPGKHVAVFRYEPESLRMGIFTSLLAIGILVVVGVAISVSGRQKRAREQGTEKI